MKIGVVVAEFNEEVTSRLFDGVKSALLSSGLIEKDIVVFRVPGAFEVPLAAKFLFSKRGVDAVVAVGAVIRGDTSHFDYVCQAAERGCLQVGLEFLKPVGFGILTTDNFDQAWQRSSLDSTNKGYETAKAVILMLKNML